MTQHYLSDEQIAAERADIASLGAFFHRFDGEEHVCVPITHWRQRSATIAAYAAQQAPIDMVLHCPKCGMQHVDMEEFTDFDRGPNTPPGNWKSWDNPPHRSHLCHACDHIWRPADVPTNGVQAVKTTGKADSPIATPAAPTAPASGAVPCRACDGEGSVNEGDPEIGNAHFTCNVCNGSGRAALAGQPHTGEPSEEMVRIGKHAAPYRAVDVYRAMIIAAPYPDAVQAAPAIPEGETLADRLDWLADRQTPGSQTQSDLFAAATIWRKHLKPSLLTQAAPAAVQGEALTRRVIHELRTYNPAADEYKGEHIHKFWARELESTLAATAPVQPVSGLSLAVIGRKHFGNPIPQEWYAAARELLATPPTPPSAPATGGKGDNHG